ncbi:MAG: hypothetical protein HQ472_02535 [Ignavibacteria bacterium]|nr:hypothetical protein [Ignavibacteria bacterium]
MTNDELLAGFLDRSLTEEELLQFETQRNSQPEFAQSVDSMLTVEGLLTKGAPTVAIPVAFLHGVEQTVTAKIASGAATSAAGVGGGLSGTAMAWMAGLGVAIVGTTAVYFSTQSSNTPQVIAPQHSTQKSVPVTVPARGIEIDSKATIESKTPEIQTPATKQVNIGAAPIASTVRPVRTARPDNADATAQNPDRALDNLMRDFEQCKLQNDNVRCAQISLAIGRTLRENGNTSGSVTFLNQSLTFAKNSRIVKYQIDALGELGLVALNERHNADARKFLQQAVDLGNANAINVDKWSQIMLDLN